MAVYCGVRVYEGHTILSTTLNNLFLSGTTLIAAQHENEVNLVGDVSKSINYIPYDHGCPECPHPCAYSPFMQVQCIRSKQEEILAQMQTAEAMLHNMHAGKIYGHQKEEFVTSLRAAREVFQKTVLREHVIDGEHTPPDTERKNKLTYQASLLAAIDIAHTMLTSLSGKVNEAIRSMPTITRKPVTDRFDITHTAAAEGGGIFRTGQGHPDSTLDKDLAPPPLDKQVNIIFKN